MTEHTIGQLAAASGCTPQTIRHYEAIGLLPTASRSIGGQRRYRAEHVTRLAFIRHARDLGLWLDDIAELTRIAEQPDQPCTGADAIIRKHLSEVSQRIARLTALREHLEHMLDHQTGGRVGACRVVEVLGDHALCATDHHAAGEGMAPRRARHAASAERA